MLKTLRIERIFLLILLLSAGVVCRAQNIRIEIEPEVVPLNQPLRISIIGENQAIESYQGFPEIEGFVKRGSTSSTSTVINNGSISYEQSISMRYLARREGTYRIPDFTLTVNGKQYSVQGRSVQVTPEAVASRNKNDPFGNNMVDNFLYPEDNRPMEYIEVDDDAFLAVTPDKREIYQGEGVNVTVTFYRGENSRAPFDFYKHNEQIAAIRKAIRPSNVWEEDFQITNHYPHRVEINGKRYIQTKLYQATYYPLTLDPIEIPAVELEMIKYKVARNPRFLARN
ncbi:MAG: BatD family protein, partial [Bacteroidota bacterium]